MCVQQPAEFSYTLCEMQFCVKGTSLILYGPCVIGEQVTESAERRDTINFQYSALKVCCWLTDCKSVSAQPDGNLDGSIRLIESQPLLALSRARAVPGAAPCHTPAAIIGLNYSTSQHTRAAPPRRGCGSRDGDSPRAQRDIYCHRPPLHSSERSSALTHSHSTPFLNSRLSGAAVASRRALINFKNRRPPPRSLN